MKKITLRVLALLMVLLMVLPVLFACGETPEESKQPEGTKAPEAQVTDPTESGKETEPGSDSESETEVETEPSIDDVYYNDPQNYLSQYKPATKEEVVYLARDNGIGNDYEAEQGTGEVLDSAIYSRNLMLEDQLNIDIVFKYADKNSPYFIAFTTDYDAEVNSTYDVICGRGQDVANICWQGYVEDLNQYGEIFNNFETSWWSEETMAELQVNNKRFFVSGDMSLALLWGMGVTHVNLDLAAQYLITKEELYNHVMNMTWTTDVMFGYAKDVYQDIDDDGKKSDGDLYGFSVNSSNIESLRVGGNYRVFGRDASGRVAIDPGYFSEEMVNYMQKLFNNNLSQGWYLSLGGTSDVRKIYTGGRSIFQPNRTYTCIRDGHTFNYTVLPNPLAEEGQEQYYTFLTHDFSLFAMSNKAGNKNLTAASLELYEVLSYEITTPVLFEVIFKVKLADDATTAEIFNITKKNVVIELARVAKYFADSDISSYFGDLIKAPTFDVSIWDAVKGLVQGDLDRINAAYFN